LACITWVIAFEHFQKHIAAQGNSTDLFRQPRPDKGKMGIIDSDFKNRLGGLFGLEKERHIKTGLRRIEPHQLQAATAADLFDGPIHVAFDHRNGDIDLFLVLGDQHQIFLLRGYTAYRADQRLHAADAGIGLHLPAQSVTELIMAQFFHLEAVHADLHRADQRGYQHHLSGRIVEPVHYFGNMGLVRQILTLLAAVDGDKILHHQPPPAPSNHGAAEQAAAEVQGKHPLCRQDVCQSWSILL
jgi:hypothetical protein